MKGGKSEFVCRECGTRSPKWMGRCPGCQAWDSLVEEARRSRRSRPAAHPAVPVALSDVEISRADRRSTGLGEMDRTLGGGIVPGQVILLGGDPGIGKSTLMLQAAGGMASGGHRTLYVTGEESPAQVRLRARRLGVEDGPIDLYAETDAARIASALREADPGGAVVDSIQVIHHPDLEGAPGSLAQVRECAASISQAAKETGLPVILIGHVTKGGVIAGPRTLEHLVDTVLYFEGDPSSALRILRSVKNRFGPTDEIGIFRMAEKGLEEVTDPGGLFLGPVDISAPGGAIVASREGRRVLLVELQALVAPTRQTMPARRVSGLDSARVSMVLAVLERWGGLDLSARDVFVNVTGGARLSEPGADLGVALAVASSSLGRPLPPRTLVVGEIGLRGEVRPVPGLDARLAEAEKLGFERVIVPKGAESGRPYRGSLELIAVDSVEKSLALGLG